MKYNRLILGALLIALTSGCCNKENKQESVNNGREKPNGYFFYNDHFCDKLEEFIDIIDLKATDKWSPREVFPILFISENYCDSTDTYSIKVTNRDIRTVPVVMRPNEGAIFIYGGKIKGRDVILAQKSIYGKLIRSEFSFIQILRDLGLEWYEEEYHELLFEGSYGINPSGYYYIDVIVNNEGDIEDIKYGVDSPLQQRKFNTKDKFIEYVKTGEWWEQLKRP